jgi:hypothetical protein
MTALCFSDMSILSRVACNHTLSLRLNAGINQMYCIVRTLKSTATDSTPQTMNLDSESQQEDPG